MSERIVNGSSLPGWVLKMREAVTASRANLDSVNCQIGALKISTAILGEEILRAQKATQESHRKAPEDFEAERQVEEMRRGRCHIVRLPPDCLWYALQFLTFEEIVGSLDAASNTIRILMTGTAIWQTLLLQQLPHLHARLGFAEKQNHGTGLQISRQPGDAIRQIVRRHWIDSRKCVAFIKVMKDQRAVPRHKSVAPRRYTSQDVTITHPLPIFETNAVDSSSHSGTGQQIGRVMSRAETLDKDFRIAALGAMEAMAELTAYPGDMHTTLVQQSAVSVFVSLLANEAQQLQYLSCTCLANLLCWDGHRCAPGLGVTVAGSGIKKQMELCEGSKILLALLTSPSASINLAGNLRGGASTAPIEGMCNREGARALVNFFCPFEMRVPPAVAARGQGCPSSARLMHELVLQQWPRLRAWRFLYYTRSGALKDEFTCYLTFSPDGRVLGRGCDSVGFFLLEGTSEIDIQGGLFKLRKQYLSESTLDELTSALSALGSEQSKNSGGGAEVMAAETLAAMTVQRAHVMHTAYYCDGLAASELTGRERESPTLGVYGVWEGASSEGNHFLLQKGGVFRAAPLAYC